MKLEDCKVGMRVRYVKRYTEAYPDRIDTSMDTLHDDDGKTIPLGTVGEIVRVETIKSERLPLRVVFDSFKGNHPMSLGEVEILPHIADNEGNYW